MGWQVQTTVGPLAKDSVTRRMRAFAIQFLLTRTMREPAQLREAHSTTLRSYSFPANMSADTSLRISAAAGSGPLIRRQETQRQNSRRASRYRWICRFPQMVFFTISRGVAAR